MSVAADRSSDVGVSRATESESAGRHAVREALVGRVTSEHDLVIIFASFDYDFEALYRGASNEAAPAAVVGCSGNGAFTHDEQVPDGCVAVFLPAEGRSFGICHLECDAGDIAGSARKACEIAQQRPATVTPTRRCCCGSRRISARLLVGVRDHGRVDAIRRWGGR